MIGAKSKIFAKSKNRRLQYLLFRFFCFLCFMTILNRKEFLVFLSLECFNADSLQRNFAFQAFYTHNFPIFCGTPLLNFLHCQIFVECQPSRHRIIIIIIIIMIQQRIVAVVIAAHINTVTVGTSTTCRYTQWLFTSAFPRLFYLIFGLSTQILVRLCVHMIRAHFCFRIDCLLYYDNTRVLCAGIRAMGSTVSEETTHPSWWWAWWAQV